jgi:penicillin amidase
VPGVIIGHNADIAWGFTNLGPDVSDLYLERVRGDRWRYDGRWRPLRTRTETIKVDDGDDISLTVRSTRHGPLMSDVSDEIDDIGSDPPGVRAGEYAVALKWTALQPSATADAVLAMDTATDWDSFRAAASSFAVPAQNLVYADRQGHIGYQAPGRIPIRKSGNDGLLPSAGWKPENDWTGDYIPFDGLPSVLDPDDGYIVTANQAVTEADYPYYLTDDWDRGYRSERIRDLINLQVGRGGLSIEDMLDIQLDNVHPMAPVLTPYLLDIDMPHGYYSAGKRQLRHWDLHQDADSPGAAYFNVVWRDLLALTFHDDLPEDAWPDGGDRWYAVVSRLLNHPHDTWWDDSTTDGVRETRDDILAQAMGDARDDLTRMEALDSDQWTWGHLHQLNLENPTLGTSGIGPVERLVNRGGWKVGGGSSTVDATSWDAAEGYDVTSAPSMRMVVSLADFDDSRWINLTGVSGHPFNGHYTDQTDLWADGQTLPWAFSRDAVEDAGDDTLTLRPPAHVE